MLPEGFINIEELRKFVKASIGDSTTVSGVVREIHNVGELVFFPKEGKLGSIPSSHYWFSCKHSGLTDLLFESHCDFIRPFVKNEQVIEGKLFYLKRFFNPAMSLDHIYRDYGVIDLDGVGQFTSISWEDILDKLATQSSIVYAEMHLVCSVTGEEFTFRSVLPKLCTLTATAEHLKTEIKAMFHDLFSIREFKIETLTCSTETQVIIDEVI